MSDDDERAAVVAFGASLARIRGLRGLSLDQLAALSGVGAGTISAIERGDHEVTLVDIYALAAALKVEPAAFFER
jgi:transcriptional regulator with XRE-family HTH domain